MDTSTAPDQLGLILGIVCGFLVIFSMLWCFVVWILSRTGDSQSDTPRATVR